MNVGFGRGYLPKTIYLLLWKNSKDLSFDETLMHG